MSGMYWIREESFLLKKKQNNNKIAQNNQTINQTNKNEISKVN